MDPGSRRDLIGVYYREPTVTDFGHSFTLEFQGNFWGSFTEVTRSMFYSGDEALRTQKIWMLQPGVRIVFNMRSKFDEEKVEFHFNDEVYIPRDNALRVGSTASPYFSYNCKLQTERQL